MASLDQVGKVATVVFSDELGTHVLYHNTQVVSFNQNTITLRSGGYETATTKTRMNQTANQYYLGFYVFQKDFDWFVDFKGETLDFTDGMVLDR